MKKISYIDTLYISLKSNKRTLEVYYHFANYVLDNSIDYIGQANGRTWYDFPNYRLGLMEFATAQRANQSLVEIQYKWEYLMKYVDLQIDMIDIELPFFTRSDWKIKRIDLSCAYISHSPVPTNYISPFRSKAIFEKGGEVETVYLGKRSTGLVYRIYDKTKELKANEHYKKMDIYHEYLGTIEDIKVTEIEIHNKKLMQGLDDYIENITEDCLLQVYAYALLYLQNIKSFDDCDLSLYNSNNYDEINKLSLPYYFTTNYYHKSKKKQTVSKLPSRQYLIDSLVSKINNYIDKIDDEEDSVAISILFSLTSRYMDMGYNIDINYDNNNYEDRRDDLNYLMYDAELRFTEKGLRKN